MFSVNELAWLLREAVVHLISLASIFIFLRVADWNIKHWPDLSVIAVVAAIMTVYVYYQYILTGSIVVASELLALFSCAVIIGIHWYFRLSLNAILVMVIPVIILVMLGMGL
ncbi:hypothetical protein HSX37_10135|uniref:Uncharacterized protein n=1 Tax=Dendrosporobacter quercicolus TaxID=146817 RepID=A0A1G9QX77_9FIRM|nr:hypothetical protein [Dendrosporobacter quercicolus]NSL48388.1 hypothetical protein [Dendrosporobacter quercicolus DSM 1736]SDM15207.1 hypothetical protein SAMN04488502_102328 [Dendrosporobacter quercicolus]